MLPDSLYISLILKWAKMFFWEVEFCLWLLAGLSLLLLLLPTLPTKWNGIGQFGEKGMESESYMATW